MSRLVFKEEPFMDEESNEKRSSNSIKKKKLRSIQAVNTSTEEVEKPTTTGRNSKSFYTSPWLSQFLSKKRVDEIALVPEIIPLNNTYIQELSDRHKVKERDEDENINSPIHEFPVDIIDLVSNSNSSPLIESSNKLGSIVLSNLPYTITEDEVRLISCRLFSSTPTFLLGEGVCKKQWMCDFRSQIFPGQEKESSFWFSNM